MSSKLAIIVADFTSQLSTQINVAGTSATLQSNVDDNGVTLPDGNFYFTLDGAISTKEHIYCVKTGANLTSIQNVSSQGVYSNGTKFVHRVGASVTITDFAHIKAIADLIGGQVQLNASCPLGYDGTASITTPNQLATKIYADCLAFNGSPNANISTKGISQIATTAQINAGCDTGSTAAELAMNPSYYVLTDFYLAGAGDDTTIARGSGNKLVTQTGLQNACEVYNTSTGSANAYVLTLFPVPTALKAGQTFRFKANFTNSGASTLAVNGLTAKNIVKNVGTTPTTALASGDIVSGQVVEVTYDGTQFQMLSPLGNIVPLVYSCGLGTWGSATADGNAHQITTDGFIIIISGGFLATLLTDSANPPTTARASASATSGDTGMSPVKKNDYYKITGSTVTAYFIPLS